ncbi:OmpH family outer membrane protein [Candidatus Pelagibacter sp.]|uniref:OmpH family outer membrane protein n=1 Tax=Candidatus Pelagibacter sp. TaxID=2024849 RepID=UPI003F863C8E
MKIIQKFFTILILLLTFISNTYSQDKIVYLDLDNIVTNTKAGKLILSELEKSKKAALLKFEKKEKDLKKIEDEIKKQKNIISEEELKKKFVKFRKEVTTFRQNKQKVINEFNKKKKKEFDAFFKKITPIIENYVSEKNIDIVLDRKDIFVASKKKDITKEIINIIDAKIK